MPCLKCTVIEDEISKSCTLVSDLLCFWLPESTWLYSKTKEKFMSQKTTFWFLKLVSSIRRIWKAFYLSDICQPFWYLSAVEIIIAKMKNRTNSKQKRCSLWRNVQTGKQKSALMKAGLRQVVVLPDQQLDKHFHFCGTLLCNLKSQNMNNIVKENEKWNLYRGKFSHSLKFKFSHSARSSPVMLCIPRKAIRFHVFLALAPKFQIVPVLRCYLNPSLRHRIPHVPQGTC